MNERAGELRRIRERASLTQQEAAALLGVGYRTYQRWEAGTTTRAIRDGDVERLRALAAKKKRA